MYVFMYFTCVKMSGRLMHLVYIAVKVTLELKPIKCIFEYSAACLSLSFEVFPGLITFASLWHAETCLH